MNKIQALIIDDEENIVNSVRLSLGLHNIDVVPAEVESVVTRINSGEYDLLLLDIYLGSVNGIELLKDILANVPGFPVIMISGLAEMEEAIEAIKLGAFDFIEKPLKTERLLVSVKNAARFRRMKKRSGEVPFLFTSP